MDMSSFRTFRVEISQLLQALRINVNKLVEPLTRAEGLTFLQFMVLSHIADDESNVNINCLCSMTGMGQANASTLCKRLEQEGLIKRERSREDERIVNLSLTDEGRAVLERIYTSFFRYADVLERYPEQDMQAIINGLHGIDSLLIAMLKYAEHNQQANS